MCAGSLRNSSKLRQGSGAGGTAGGMRGPIAHAKQMGTVLTACGENAFTWSGYWHLPFVESGGTKCRA